MKIKPKSVLLKLPSLLYFEDYHEIGHMEDNFNELIAGKNKIKSEELGFCDGGYMAIFYLKKDKDYKLMKKEANDALKKLEQEECKGRGLR